MISLFIYKTIEVIKNKSIIYEKFILEKMLYDIKYSKVENKNELLLNYKKWVKGVDDVYQVLADHQDDFNAKYYNGLYTIVLGEGKGKSLEGKLQVSYCTSSKEIKKKSWLIKMFS